MKERVCDDIFRNKEFLALAYSEFGSGVHFYKPEINVKVEDEVTILSGRKSMVTSAGYATYYLVLALVYQGKKK